LQEVVNFRLFKLKYESLKQSVLLILNNKAKRLFSSLISPLLKQAFLEAAGAIVEIGFSLKPNYHNQV